MAIGAYDHHDSLDVEPEVTRVADLLAEFGGEITTPWDIPMPQRGSDAVGARLGSWSHSAGGHTVVHWVGHGGSDRDRAALAHARSPRHVGTEGVSPERLADHLTDREARSDASAPWLIVIIDACKSARFVELLSAALDARQSPRRARHRAARHVRRRRGDRVQRAVAGAQTQPARQRGDPQERRQCRVAPPDSRTRRDSASRWTCADVQRVLAELSEDERRRIVEWLRVRAAGCGW